MIGRRVVAAAGAALSCSSATGDGVDDLKRLLFTSIPAEAAPAEPVEPELADYLVYRPAPAARRRFRILRDSGTLRVAGRDLERKAEGLDPDDDADVAALAGELEELGVERALRDAGARPGDDILVGAHRFTFKPRGA